MAIALATASPAVLAMRRLFLVSVASRSLSVLVPRRVKHMPLEVVLLYRRKVLTCRLVAKAFKLTTQGLQEAIA